MLTLLIALTFKLELGLGGTEGEERSRESEPPGAALAAGIGALGAQCAGAQGRGDEAVGGGPSTEGDWGGLRTTGRRRFRPSALPGLPAPS